MTQTDLATLKSLAPIESVIRSRGIALVRRGSSLVGLCPFHDDTHPSLSVTPERGLFHCFACGAGGDVIRFVERLDGVSFSEALRILAGHMGYTDAADGSLPQSPQLPSQLRSPLRAMMRKPPGITAMNQPDNQTNPENDTSPSSLALLDPSVQQAAGMAFDHYAKTLEKSGSMRDYLLGRRIVGADLLETFSIGYAVGNLIDRLPPASSEEGASLRESLARCGLLKKVGRVYREHFAGCAVFAIRDERGVIRQIYGRRLPGLPAGPGKTGNGPRHLYLPGPHDTFFNPLALGQEELILCEGISDALAFWLQGMRNVSFAYGTGGLTETLVDRLAASNVRRVILAFDGDEAGNEGARRIGTLLLQRGLRVSLIHFPEDRDACDLHEKGGDLRPYLERAEELHGSDETVNVSAGESQGDADRTATDTDASVACALPPAAIHTEGRTLTAKMGDRSYRIDGFSRNQNETSLSVTLMVEREGRFHLDKLDLYVAKDRERFIKGASSELCLDSLKEDVYRQDLQRLVASLRGLQDDLIARTEEEKRRSTLPVTYEMSETERAAALDFLRSVDLMDRLREDFGRCGIAGEETNLLIAYLAATSRLLDKPLHVLFQSSSAAGKTTLMKAVLEMMPPESVLLYSALTEQSLYYMQGRDLRHTILAIEEDVGAERAGHIIKMLKTEGRARRVSTIKDPQTGLMNAMDFEVEGPIVFFLTSTSLSIDEEMWNRDLVLSADESREQTRRILEMQRFLQTKEGWRMRHERERTRTLHRNAQRLLKPYRVVNPFAGDLRFPDHRHRLRRDHDKYTGLIAAVTLLYQHQREIKREEIQPGVWEEYIEATREDIRRAGDLARIVLGRSLDDVPPQTRSFLRQASELIRKKASDLDVDASAVRLTTRELREKTGLSIPTIHRHLWKLQELECVQAWSVPHSRRMEYEIIFDDEESLDMEGFTGESLP